jgi:hypothetical protein
VRRYEELLGLAPGRLVATADTIYRYAARQPNGPPMLARGAAAEAGSNGYMYMEELLDRALSTDEMSGWQWDELTGQLSLIPAVVIVPRRLWADLADRLVEETVVSDGLAWMMRFEALNRLLGHPGGQQATIAALMSLVSDPTNQVFVEPVSVLDASSHPDAGRHVLGQLARPINERTRYGALLACIRKVRFGHFSPEQLGGLVPVVMQMLEDPESHTDGSALGVEVLRRLPPGLRADANAGLRRALAGDRTLNEVLSAGRLAASAPSAVVVSRIVRTVSAEMIRENLGFTDDLLPVLVDEMLYAPVLDVRLYAAVLIQGTPYAPQVAAAVGAELAKPQVVADPTLANSLLGGLRIIGGAAERPLVERLILAPGIPPDVAVEAVRSIGHVGGVSTDRFWLTALALHSRGWRRHRSRHNAAALTGLVYGLGITRNLRLLARVRDDEEAPDPVRASARWWLDRSNRVYASVRS